MKSIARIAIAFAAGTSSNIKLYDIWEHVIIANSSNHRSALDSAFSISKLIFDNIKNIRLLGYSDKPLLYAMISIDTDIELQFQPHIDLKATAFITKIATLNEYDFERLRSYEDVSVPYRLGYIFN